MPELKLQDAPIDVRDWLIDDLYASYPEGARSKDAFFPPSTLDLDFINKKRRHLYKRSDKKYPDQFWGEVAAYHIGCILGVNVPPAFAAFNSEAGDCGTLIEWFYEDGKAEFTPGGSYMQSIIPEFDRKKGELHSFRAIKIWAGAYCDVGLIKEDWYETWANAFLFDALIGNTDRHQDNWGYLLPKNGDMLEFAPLFDNGTSLGYERFEEYIGAWTDLQYEIYINKGKHHVRWDLGDNKGCGHFDLLDKVILEMPDLRQSLRSKIEQFDTHKLDESLDHLCTLRVPIALTQFRKNLYIRLIQLRKQKLLVALA